MYPSYQKCTYCQKPFTAYVGAASVSTCTCSAIMHPQWQGRSRTIEAIYDRQGRVVRETFPSPVPPIPMPAPLPCILCGVCRKSFPDIFRQCASCRVTLCSSCFSQSELIGNLAYCSLCHYEGDYPCGQ